jgi:hypothetical protein
MTDRELMQMALDALENYKNVVTSSNDPQDFGGVVDGGEPARNAIKALGDRLAQPPASWPYKPEQLKREWVGFTHEELAWLNEALNLGGRFAVIEAIEAKLKEKNT